MAVRRQRPADQVRGDEAELDPVEAADEAADPEHATLEIDPELDELDDPGDGDEDDGDDPGEDGDETVAEALPDEVGDDELDATPAVVPSEAAFDDEEDAAVAAVTSDDDDEDEIDGLRAGEFVCRSCYMAKLETQLADAERVYCRDCA